MPLVEVYEIYYYCNDCNHHYPVQFDSTKKISDKHENLKADDSRIKEFLKCPKCNKTNIRNSYAHEVKDHLEKRQGKEAEK